MNARFNAIIKLSADTPAQLRRCDVWRVMSAADNMSGDDGGFFLDFCEWLEAQRPRT